jgi:hypothetical protein
VLVGISVGGLRAARQHVAVNPKGGGPATNTELGAGALPAHALVEDVLGRGC